MGKGGGSQTVTSVPDAGTQDYVRQMRQLALGYVGFPGQGDPNAGGGQAYGGGGGLFGAVGNRLASPGLTPMTPPPLPPGIQQAIGQYGQYANAGQQGLAALTGDAGAQAQFLNPYRNAMDPFFAQQRQQAVEGANQQATLAGAFGGDRSQIGAAVAGNQADQTQAGFNYQGFLEAMQRAQAASQMGFGAIGAGAFLPQQYQSGQLGLLQQALGPYGQTQTQPLYRNAGAGAIGGALAGAPLGPLGIIGGGVLGSGLFG